MAVGFSCICVFKVLGGIGELPPCACNPTKTTTQPYSEQVRTRFLVSLNDSRAVTLLPYPEESAQLYCCTPMCGCVFVFEELKNNDDNIVTG